MPELKRVSGKFVGRVANAPYKLAQAAILFHDSGFQVVPGHLLLLQRIVQIHACIFRCRRMVNTNDQSVGKALQLHRIREPPVAHRVAQLLRLLNDRLNIVFSLIGPVKHISGIKMMWIKNFRFRLPAGQWLVFDIPHIL